MPENDRDSNDSNSKNAAIMARFREFDLHDSRLRGVSIRDVEPALHEVVLTLELLGGRYPNYEWRDARLIFHECSDIDCNMNLVVKAWCSDAIYEGECAIDQVADRHGIMHDHIRFSLDLCPPSGHVRIVARDFELEIGSLIPGNQ